MHKITPALRSRMVDWVIEVLTNFRCEDQTYFVTISIMDRYFKAKQEAIEVSDLHLIGVTCMYMASKYEDIYPLKMSMVYEKIAHKKLTTKQIIETERDILKTLDYDFNCPTALEFLLMFSDELFKRNTCSQLKLV